jgi:hypothetical protein
MLMNINGDGSKFLRITIGNVLTTLFVVSSALGVYYRLDGRVHSLEMIVPPPSDVAHRMESMEGKIDDMTPRIIRTETNVLWLMYKQHGTKPTP